MTETTGDPLTFDRAASEYREGRPPYPEEMFDFLGKLGALRSGSRVLEIGPGTGIATRQLIGRGASVVAVEVGETFADRLRVDFQRDDCVVLQQDASIFLPREGSFDAVVAATSLHWIDRSALPNLVRGLVPGGWFCAWWTVYHDPDIDTAFQTGVHDLYRRHLPDYQVDLRSGPRPLQVADRADELAGAGLRDVRWKWFRWSTSLTGAQLRMLYSTFPAIENRPAQTRERFLTDLVSLVGGDDASVEVHYVTALYAGRR